MMRPLGRWRRRRTSRVAFGVNADVIAMDVEGTSSGSAGSRTKPIRCSSSERKLSAVQPCCRNRNFRRARSRFSRRTSLRGNFGDAAGDGDDLLPGHKGVKAHGQVRIGRRPPPTRTEIRFEAPDAPAGDGSKANVVDLGIIAPGAAAGDRHLELAGEIVKLGVAAQRAIDLQRER